MVCSQALGEVDRAVLMETAGRTHMAIVHFPVALVVAAAIFEFVRILSRRDRPSPAALGCLTIAVIGAGMAATTGWWHADFIRRSGESLVEWHRWLGIAGGSLALVALVLGLVAKRGSQRVVRRLYVVVVVLAAGTIGFVGHKGGEITFREGYVFELLLAGPESDGPNRSGSAPVTPIDGSALLEVDFEQHLLPIFQISCIECHGATKQSGKLRLDSLEALRASPYIDEVVVAGDASASAMIQRLTLPKTDRDFMPKRGDPLADAEIAIIAQWINARKEAGALPNSKHADGGGVVSPEPSDLRPANESLTVIAAVAARGAHASLESAGSRRLIVNFSVLSRPITDEDLAILQPVAGSVVELNLGGVGVTDEMMRTIAAFGQIERLNLSRSEITDSGIEALSSLERLEVLNIYGSTVTDGAVAAIGALPALKRVYIWRTMIGDEGRARLSAVRPGLEIIAGAEEPATDEPQDETEAEPETVPEDDAAEPDDADGG